jgi:hypothetical protein
MADSRNRSSAWETLAPVLANAGGAAGRRGAAGALREARSPRRTPDVEHGVFGVTGPIRGVGVHHTPA